MFLVAQAEVKFVGLVWFELKIWRYGSMSSMISSRDGQKIILNKNFVHKFLFQIILCSSLISSYAKNKTLLVFLVIIATYSTPT